jgi:hypothetical protein
MVDPTANKNTAMTAALIPTISLLEIDLFAILPSLLDCWHRDAARG